MTPAEAKERVQVAREALWMTLSEFRRTADRSPESRQRIRESVSEFAQALRRQALASPPDHRALLTALNCLADRIERGEPDLHAAFRLLAPSTLEIAPDSAPGSLRTRSFRLALNGRALLKETGLLHLAADELPERLNSLPMEVWTTLDFRQAEQQIASRITAQIQSGHLVAEIAAGYRLTGEFVRLVYLRGQRRSSRRSGIATAEQFEDADPAPRRRGRPPKTPLPEDFEGLLGKIRQQIRAFKEGHPVRGRAAEALLPALRARSEPSPTSSSQGPVRLPAAGLLSSRLDWFTVRRRIDSALNDFLGEVTPDRRFRSAVRQVELGFWPGEHPPAEAQAIRRLVWHWTQVKAGRAGDPDVERARRLDADPVLSAIVRARLIAGDETAAIAESLELPPALVTLYRDLFADFRGVSEPRCSVSSSGTRDDSPLQIATYLQAAVRQERLDGLQLRLLHLGEILPERIPAMSFREKLTDEQFLFCQLHWAIHQAGDSQSGRQRVQMLSEKLQAAIKSRFKTLLELPAPDHPAAIESH